MFAKIHIDSEKDNALYRAALDLFKYEMKSKGFMIEFNIGKNINIYPPSQYPHSFIDINLENFLTYLVKNILKKSGKFVKYGKANIIMENPDFYDFKGKFNE